MLELTLSPSQRSMNSATGFPSWPVSVVINGFTEWFYPKTGAWECAEHLLIQLATLALIKVYTFSSYPLFCSSSRLQTPPYLETGFQCCYFKTIYGGWNRVGIGLSYRADTVQKYRAPGLLNRGLRLHGKISSWHTLGFYLRTQEDILVNLKTTLPLFSISVTEF